MSDGFLARWSRRKRDEARRPPEPPAVVPEAASPAEDETSLSPEELAQLPSLDALTAATDLTPFLRTGVPRVLRNAALRRMWSIDPAIRDFVSEAREYAYDWNTPGGVPGTGGAISAEDVRAMVEKVFGGVEEKTSAPSDDSDVAEESAALPAPRGRGEDIIDPVVDDVRDIRSLEALSLPTANLSGEQKTRGFPPPPSAGEGGERSEPGEGQRDADPGSALHGGRDLSGSGVPSPGPLRGPPSPAEGGGENLRHSAYPDRPAPTGIGIAHQTPELSSLTGKSPNYPEPPPSPPRLRRHGGALPI
ncbi:DUF3306 domain-containing protein [Methylobacterium aquaticum]|uniref:DUF3306 domain-containing protein n=1 Tax=Methylobacterium aquaticum TaxID=270351 RepID=UPI003D7C2592